MLLLGDFLSADSSLLCGCKLLLLVGFRVESVSFPLQNTAVAAPPPQPYCAGPLEQSLPYCQHSGQAVVIILNGSYLKSSQCKRGTLSHFCLTESVNPPGERYPTCIGREWDILTSKTGTQGQRLASTNLGTPLTQHPKAHFCWDSLLTKHPNLSFFVLSKSDRCIVSLSKNIKSCLPWSFLRSHFYGNSVHTIKNLVFFSCSFVLCQFCYH